MFISSRRLARHATPSQRGISLVELLLFIVIMGIALVAILQVQSRSVLMSAEPQLRKQALAIAESLLEEITLAKFTFCDPTDLLADTAANPAGCGAMALQEAVNQEAGGSARPFDNVNDYVTAFGVPTDYTTDAAGGRLARWLSGQCYHHTGCRAWARPD